VAQWLKRSPLLLKVSGSKQSLSTGFNNNSLCSPSSKYVPEFLQSWRRSVTKEKEITGTVFLFSSPVQDSCQESCRNWPTES